MVERESNQLHERIWGIEPLYARLLISVDDPSACLNAPAGFILTYGAEFADRRELEAGVGKCPPVDRGRFLYLLT